MQQYNWRHLLLSILITSLRSVVVASTVHRYTTAIHLLRLFTLSVPFQPTIEKSSNNSVSSLPIQKTSSLSSPSSQHWHHILSRNPTARHNGNLNPAPLTEPQNGNCQSSASSYSPPSLPHKIHISLTLHTSCSHLHANCAVRFPWPFVTIMQRPRHYLYFILVLSLDFCWVIGRNSFALISSSLTILHHRHQQNVCSMQRVIFFQDVFY